MYQFVVVVMVVENFVEMVDFGESCVFGKMGCVKCWCFDVEFQRVFQYVFVLKDEFGGRGWQCCQEREVEEDCLEYVVLFVFC